MKDMKGFNGAYGLFIFLALLLPSQGFASNAYFVDTQDARANGMMEAFAATADNPSAVYYNPAGIVNVDGTQVSAGLTFVYIPGEDVPFESNGTSVFGAPGETTDSETLTAYIPSFFATHRINNDWSAGFGMFSNFGLSTEWPEDWEGRYVSGGVYSDILTMALNPVVAYRVDKNVSIAAGIVYQTLEVQSRNKYLMGAPGSGIPDATVKVTAEDSSGFGYSLGFLARLSDAVNLGIAFQSAVRHDMDGDFELYGTPGGQFNAKDDVSMKMTLPAIARLGLAYSKGPLTVEGDVVFTQWSTIDESTIKFDQLPLSGTEPKDYRNTFTYRLGTNYSVNNAFDVRGGVEYSGNPIPLSTQEPAVPTNYRWRFGVGGGYTMEKFVIDLSYNYIFWPTKMEYDNETGDYDANVSPGLGKVTGEWDASGHMVVTTLSYKF
jgi:long-chain fatty acid transport protein